MWVIEEYMWLENNRYANIRKKYMWSVFGDLIGASNSIHLIFHQNVNKIKLDKTYSQFE